MNIAFYTCFQVSPTKGGTESITFSLATCLKECLGYSCFSMYSIKENEEDEPVFSDTLCLAHLKNPESIEKLESFLLSNQIQAIINQGVFELQPLFAGIASRMNIRLILAHHFEPGWELNFLSISTIKDQLCSSRSIKHNLFHFAKLLLYPFLKLRYDSRMRLFYKLGYDYSDTVVLLSECHKKGFMDFANIKDDSKFKFIPNMLTLKEKLSEKELDCKEKKVLIVSRLEEKSKRLSLALRIWKEIEKEQDPAISDWTLEIVGHGVDEAYYHRLSQEFRLNRVRFCGRQRPYLYYKRSALFMMTSCREGWGLTLTESQQMGVVPIAFDSYKALHEIITDGFDGIIVRDHDLFQYKQRMLRLMKDADLRRKIALQAITSAQRFAPENVVKLWDRCIRNSD